MENEYPWGVFCILSVRRCWMAQEVVRLSIEGMHCGGCVRRVTAALQDLRGVEVGLVEVGSAEVRFDPGRANVDEIAGAVDRIGFAARIEKVAKND
jgi:copper chaperone